MSHYICAISGLDIATNHFPIYLNNRECMHPIFYVPQRKLFGYTRKWAGNELTREDSYLLFLALLNSTERVFFRTHAIRNEQTDSLVAQNMESLLITISRMNSVMNPQIVFPSFVVSPDTCTLSNIKHWIENWNSAYTDFKSNYVFSSTVRKLSIREAALQKMIKSPHRDPSSYAMDLAKWASVAGSFPEYLTDVEGIKMPLCDYWEKIIIAAANKRFFTIPKSDLKELIEHCEINIEPGTIYHHKLLEVIRAAKNYLDMFIGNVTASRNLTSGIWGFPEDTDKEDEDDVFAANLAQVVANAPETEPRRDMYRSKMDYIVAKIKWDTAQSLKVAKKHLDEEGE